jgi:hypothetical protein
MNVFCRACQAEFEEATNRGVARGAKYAKAMLFDGKFRGLIGAGNMADAIDYRPELFPVCTNCEAG